MKTILSLLCLLAVFLGLPVRAAPPTLVFQSGFGDGRSAWDALLPLLAPDLPRYLHERPGNGDAPAVDLPRDPCAQADELHATLQAQGIAPPYLLVGHSIGGLYQYAFARRYPEAVAGVLLIDPTHPDNWQAIKENMPEMAMLVQGLKRVVFNVSRRREFDEQTVCLDQLASSPMPMPVILLGSGRPDAQASPAYEKRRFDMARDWVRRTGGRLETLWHTGHYIQREDPQAVAGAIDRLLGRTSAPAAEATQSRAFELLGRQSLLIEPGKTTARQIEMHWKQADEVFRDAQKQIWVFREPRLKFPAFISWLPVVGDITDAVEAVGSLRTSSEAIVEISPGGTVSRAWLRKVSLSP